MVKHRIKLPQQRLHWYHLTVEECVLCGCTTEYRQRRDGKKPEDPKERYKYIQFACGIHFC